MLASRGLELGHFSPTLTQQRLLIMDLDMRSIQYLTNDGILEIKAKILARTTG